MPGLLPESQSPPGRTDHHYDQAQDQKNKSIPDSRPVWESGVQRYNAAMNYPQRVV